MDEESMERDPEEPEVWRRVVSGRIREARLNDALIPRAVRRVLQVRPDATMATIAREAEVGMSALYTRYGSRDQMLRIVGEDARCRVEERLTDAERRIEAGDDAGRTYSDLLRDALENHLDLFGLDPAASRTLFDRVQAAGAIRGDVTHDDLAAMVTAIGAVREHAGRGPTARRQVRLLELVMTGVARSHRDSV